MTAIDLSFERVEKLIYWQVHRFVAKHGGEFDDLLGEAGKCFCFARDSFDPARGVKFSTWVAYRVWRGLQKYRDKGTRRTSREAAVDLDFDYQPDQSRSFLADLLDGLSADARHLIGLAVDPDTGLVHLRGDRENKRKALASLLHDLGWAGRRIAECFREVREALYTL